MEEKEEAKENSKKEQEEVNKEEGLERYFARRITKERARRKTPVILGRNGNIKDTLVKVADISIDSGKIALEGEIINTDSRELKVENFL